MDTFTVQRGFTKVTHFLLKILNNRVFFNFLFFKKAFIPGQDSDKCQQLPIIRHLSWKNLTSICDIDIDIYVTNLMKILIQNGFSTDGR